MTTTYRFPTSKNSSVHRPNAADPHWKAGSSTSRNTHKVSARGTLTGTNAGDHQWDDDRVAILLNRTAIERVPSSRHALVSLRAP